MHNLDLDAGIRMAGELLTAKGKPNPAHLRSVSLCVDSACAELLRLTGKRCGPEDEAIHSLARRVLNSDDLTETARSDVKTLAGALPDLGARIGREMTQRGLADDLSGVDPLASDDDANDLKPEHRGRLPAYVVCQRERVKLLASRRREVAAERDAPTRRRPITFLKQGRPRRFYRPQLPLTHFVAGDDQP